MSVHDCYWTHASTIEVMNKVRLWVNEPIEGFHVMSYQANFASRHTPDCHVGFLSHRTV